VPTTLLAQVDAGIGLKTGVNFNGAKSYLGAFHPPTAVLVDPTALRTLTAEQLRQGLAEIVKIAVVRDAALVWKLISQGPALLSGGLQHPPELRDEVIRRAIALMLEELERNPTEKLGYERLVDFGHTFSPLLEAATGFRLSHGDAVAVDMALSCLIGVELNLTHPSVAEQVIALLVQLGLPIFRTELTLDLGEKAVASALAHRGGSLNLVVPTTLGAATFVRTPSRIWSSAPEVFRAREPGNSSPAADATALTIPGSRASSPTAARA
jgi:3-dehydroquinate synthase